MTPCQQLLMICARPHLHDPSSGGCLATDYFWFIYPSNPRSNAHCEQHLASFWVHHHFVSPKTTSLRSWLHTCGAHAPVTSHGVLCVNIVQSAIHPVTTLVLQAWSQAFSLSCNSWRAPEPEMWGIQLRQWSWSATPCFSLTTAWR